MIALPLDPTEEELARDWTLTAADLVQVRRCRGDDKRHSFALQLCVLRQYGLFLGDDYSSLRLHRAPRPTWNTSGAFESTCAIESTTTQLTKFSKCTCGSEQRKDCSQTSCWLTQPNSCERSASCGPDNLGSSGL